MKIPQPKLFPAILQYIFHRAFGVYLYLNTDLIKLSVQTLILSLHFCFSIEDGVCTYWSKT